MTIIELEQTKYTQSALCHRPGIWMFNVFETGNFFPWFSKGVLDYFPVGVSAVIVDKIRFSQVNTISDLYDRTFCQIENTVYVRCEAYYPLWMYHVSRYNIIIGFTDEKPFLLGYTLYRAGLDYIPKISDKSDNLEYASMTFRNDTIDLLNTKGQFDDVIRYFGNNIRVKSLINNTWQNLYEYYIKNVKIKSEKTTFICGDRREKLVQQVPNGRFAMEEYPKMKKELEGEIRQDVYGKCEWVKCVCVDELDIFLDQNGTVKKTWRTFYVSRKITTLMLIDERDPKNIKTLYNHVWIKQTQPDEASGSKEVWTPCPVDLGHSDFSKGIFAVDILYCMNAIWEGYDVPEVFELRACGWFNPQNTPLEIIKELLGYYCEIPYNDYMFNIQEIEREIAGLAPIGIVYDSDMGVFDAIEKLQNASNLGFQFKTDFDRFTARLDDNERAVSDTIKIHEIVDIDQIEIDMNRENYATIVDIAYNKNWYHDTAQRYTGKNNRELLLAMYDIDRIYAPEETYLIDYQGAKDKADRLEKIFSKTRPIINNIQVLKHTNLKVYDIITIDLRIPVERKGELKQMATLFEKTADELVVFGDWPGENISVDFGDHQKNIPHREFGGILKCKVMSVSLDLNSMVNTISVMEAG
jgi:hypothetical protein